MAGSGYDWLLFDTEHSHPLTVLAQLQAVAPYDVSAIVRPASNDTVLIKRFLDLGAQTLLIPYVQNADEARRRRGGPRYGCSRPFGSCGETLKKPISGLPGRHPDLRASDWWRMNDRP